MKAFVALAILRDLIRREAQVCCYETQHDEGSYRVLLASCTARRHHLHSPANGLRTRICGMSICMATCVAFDNNLTADNQLLFYITASSSKRYELGSHGASSPGRATEMSPALVTPAPTSSPQVACDRETDRAKSVARSTHIHQQTPRRHQRPANNSPAAPVSPEPHISMQHHRAQHPCARTA